MHLTPAKASAGSRRFWVTVLCFAIANASVWVGYDRWQKSHRHHLLEVTQFTPGDGATIEGRPTLTWSFNLDIASAGKDAAPPGQITPPVAGKWEWPDARTLTFTPHAPLPRATAITVTLAQETLHTPDGFRLPRAYVSSLRTPALGLVEARQAVFDERDRVVIELSFTDKVSPAEVFRHLSLRGSDGKAIAFQPHGEAAGSKVRVITEPVTALFAGNSAHAIDVMLARGLAGEGGPLGLPADRSERVTIAADIVATEATAYFPSRDEPSITVRFNNDVDLEAIKQVLSIEPAVPITLSHSYDDVILRGSFQPGSHYTVKFARPPAGMAARKLPRATSLGVLIPDRSPGLWFESEAGYLGTEGNRTLLAHAVNLTDLKVSVTRVYDNNLVAWRNGASYDRWRGITSYARPIATQDIRLPTRRNEKQDVRLSLDELLPAGEARDGVYQITLSATPPGTVQRHRTNAQDDEEDSDDSRYGRWGTSTVVTLSDIGLSAKQGRDGVTVWATSLHTARPSEAVRLRLYSNKNQLLGEATTDRNGLAKIVPMATPPGEKPGVVIAEKFPNPTNHEAVSVREDAETAPGARPKANSSAEMPMAVHAPEIGLTWLDLRTSEVAFGDSDTSGRPYLRKGYEAFVYTDRGIYRPGELVHLRAILRGADGAKPPRFPVRWQIRRPDLRDWKAQMSEVDDDGATTFELQLPADLPMGRWTAHIGLPGENGSAGKFFGSVAFDIEDFLPQRMKVAVEIEGADAKAHGRELPRIALTDEPIAADVQADYLFGRPVAERPATLIVRADPVPFAPAQYREWSFGDAANTAEALGQAKELGRRAELPETDLDANGHAKWDVDLASLIDKGSIDGDGSTGSKKAHSRHKVVKKPASSASAPGNALNYTGPWRLTVTGSVTEAGGRAVTATRAVDVDRSPHYVGLHPRETAPRPGVPTEFDVQLVTPAGTPATADGWAEATFFRETWNSSYVYEHGGYRFHSTRLLEPVQKEPQRVAIEHGRGLVSVTPPAGGSYVLLVRDLKTQCITTIAFYAGYGAWEDNISRQNPEKLDIVVQPLADPGLDKWMAAMEETELPGLFDVPGKAPAAVPAGGKIRIGHPAQAIVRSPFPGTLLLSVETDGVISTRVLDMPANTIAVPIDVPESCRPNAYVTATVLRAIDPAAKWQTHRAIGTVRMAVDNSDRKLTVELAGPKEIRPATSLSVPLRVLDSEGNPVANAAVTVAAVDEGICQVTNFLTPDPFAFFTGKRALGVHSADLYGQLMPEIAKAHSESAVGGDDDAAFNSRHNSPIKGKRVKPVALVTGVLHTDAQGLAKADFSVPEFAGQLRVMAVASAEKAFGSADQGVLVRSPLLVQSSWPRFVAPGDRFSVPLVAFNNSPAGGRATVTVELGGDASPLRFAANKATSITLPDMNLRPGGQAIAAFDVIVQEATGIARVHLLARMGSETYEENVEIPVRPASPAMADGGFLPAKPGTSTFVEIPGGMLAQTVHYELRVSSSPQLQLPEGLDYLDHYPYGCVEQTTSTLFPLVYLSDVGEKISPGMFDKDRVADKVRVGVLRLMSMQTADGGLAMWPGGREDWAWGTVYATHFLVEANAAGHDVPEEFRNQLLAYLHALLAQPQTDTATVELQAYAAYVLASAGKPDRAAMSRLSEVLNSDLGTSQARFHLAAAWLAAGRRDLATGLLPQALPAPRAGRELDGNVGSPIRDQALIASTLLAVDPADPRIPDLIQKLADAGKARQWRSTQDTAFALMAIGRYLRQTKSDVPYETAQLLQDGKPIASAEDGQSLVWAAAAPDEQPGSDSTKPGAALPAPGTKLEVRLTGPATAKGYVSWLRTGVPLKAAAGSDNGLKIRRRYLDEHGKPLEALRVHSGDLVQVELTLEGSGPMEHIVVEDLLPAGLEIENPRLEGNAAGLVTRGNSRPHLNANEEPHFAAGRADVRDDRLILIGNLTDGRAGTYTYTARAVAPGVFVVPPVKAECMYDSATNSLSGGGTFTVVAADSAKIADTGKE
ncbi:MAG TPA: MG2 domain-containing protein [Tepidisphaeraceae bacterium]|jgi:hypothetical protein|nr:MG2 domain-containing protein [Tepidisphaeraceae bacterium]